MTPEQERENTIHGMRYVASDTARIRKMKRECPNGYGLRVRVYCAKCGRSLPPGRAIGSRCSSCDDTVALEKKKVERKIRPSDKFDHLFVGFTVGSVGTATLFAIMKWIG